MLLGIGEQLNGRVREEMRNTKHTVGAIMDKHNVLEFDGERPDMKVSACEQRQDLSLFILWILENIRERRGVTFD